MRMKFSILMLVLLACGGVFAQGQSMASTYNRGLEKELVKMAEQDQKYRAEWQTKMMKASAESRSKGDKASAALMKKQDAADRKNIARLDAIIRQHGWPGRSLAGNRGSGAAFLILQHADLSHLQKYLPLIKEAVTKGEANAADAAHVEDRVLVEEGKPQIYGTRLHFGPETGGRWELYPIIDEEHVDERRARVGLPSMAEYLKLFGLEYRPKKN
jgi:Family of unknown function (DUF6624)